MNASPETAANVFQRRFRGALARQVEYSFDDTPGRVTTMIPLDGSELLADVMATAVALPFAGTWSWAVRRLARAVQPDAFLLRLDWAGSRARAVTLYARFPDAPDDASFFAALAHARPFVWHGPAPSALAAALGLRGPRGIALRAADDGSHRTALYFRSEEHVGAAWGDRLAALLSACALPPDLAPVIEDDLRPLYRPGPIGVVGVDGGDDPAAKALKFDPAEVPLATALNFLGRHGTPSPRVDALRAMANGLRADSASYVGVKYAIDGFAGARLYFACEPTHARRPGLPRLGPH